jgi:hypothetical protein
MTGSVQDFIGTLDLKNFSSITEAALAQSDFAGGVTLTGGLVSRGDAEIHLMDQNGQAFAIPESGIVSISAIEEQNSQVPGEHVAVRIKNGTRVVLARVLEVGKDIVPAIPYTSLLACPSQCTQPQQCTRGCCCDGKKCQGESSCV